MCGCVAAWMELSNVVDIWPNVMDSKFLVHCCFCFAYIWGDFLWNRSCPWLEIPHGNMHHSNQWSRVCRRVDEGNAHHQRPGATNGLDEKKVLEIRIHGYIKFQSLHFFRRDSHMQCGIFFMDKVWSYPTGPKKLSKTGCRRLLNAKWCDLQHSWVYTCVRLTIIYVCSFWMC